MVRTRSRRAAAIIGLVLAVLAVAPAAQANHPAPFAKPLNIPPTLTGSRITLTARQADVPIFNGNPTRMWTYNGVFPGPTIRQATGLPTEVTLVNNLPAAGALTLHNHGNHSAPQYDGQPHSFLVPPGGSRTYVYDGAEAGGNERGAPQWYHDHHMDVTGRNTWMGLAGFYIIDDPADPSRLPSGEFDVPLMLVDRSFDLANQLNYVFDQDGVKGDHILANGVPQPYLDVGDRRYRFRILNASNASDYELALSNGQSMTQIGTDSGLLPAPVQRQTIRLGPAERADVVINFAGPLGRSFVLRNRLGGSGATRDVMQFRVNRDLTDSSSVPASLRPKDNLGTPTVTRTFDFDRAGGRWTINGLPFDTNRVDARPVLGTTEKWVFRNTTASTHVVHVHDVDQQLISRNGQAPSSYEQTKESWSLGPGETIELLLKFTDHLGRYVLHCHILEHEDDSMMSQFEVVPPPPKTRIVVVKDAVPNAPQDFSFTAGGGLSPTTFKLDDDGDSANALSNTKAFDNLTPRSGYSISEAVPSGWVQLGATCDDGSPVSNISVSQGETVTCTFTNRTAADPCQGAPLWPGATSGNDSVIGTSGDDVIYAGDGADTIRGLGGNDAICGGRGNDKLDGGLGNDYLDGGAGATDTANTLDYTPAAGPVTVDLQGGRTTSEKDGMDTLVNRFREVDGSRYADKIFGGPAGERFDAGRGADTLAGGGGNDTINGDGGTDRLDGGPGADLIGGGPEIDTATYATRTSAVVVDIDGVADDGAAGEGDNVKPDVENLTGGAGADSLTGNASTDNVLNGGKGADALRGLGGADTASYAERATPVTVAINGVADDGSASDGPAGARDNVMTDVENLIGGRGGDDLRGSAAMNSLTGGLGADSLRGLGGNDTLLANDGVVDAALDCGPGTDSAHVDSADPAATGCESVVVAGSLAAAGMPWTTNQPTTGKLAGVQEARLWLTCRLR
jgi:spore coat protein A, manganese oxidase